MVILRLESITSDWSCINFQTLVYFKPIKTIHAQAKYLCKTLHSQGHIKRFGNVFIWRLSTGICIFVLFSPSIYYGDLQKTHSNFLLVINKYKFEVSAKGQGVHFWHFENSDKIWKVNHLSCTKIRWFWEINLHARLTQIFK